MIDETGRPLAAGRDYDRAEITVDAVVHLIGLVFEVIGAIILIAYAARSNEAGELPVSIVYVLGLLAMLGFSAAYNLWPVSRIKWLLRRFDHSAIYLLIAATYTPFTVQMRSGLASGLLVGIWTAAAVGIVLKLVLPGRFDRLSLVLYLLLGWRCDAVRCDHLAAVLDHMAAGRGRRALLAGRRLPPMGEPALP